jgi:hypothetical protein
MGYTTTFAGSYSIFPKPDKYITEYMRLFSDSRRMGYERLNPIYGTLGAFYVHNNELKAMNYKVEPVDGNQPPPGQPGLWCDWFIEKDKLKWCGREKFYNYDDWLLYLINYFFGPAGYILNGQVSFQGEDSDDKGLIILIDNTMIKSSGSKKRVRITSENKDIILVKELLAGHRDIKIIEPKYEKITLDFKVLVETPINPYIS